MQPSSGNEIWAGRGVPHGARRGGRLSFTESAVTPSGDRVFVLQRGRDAFERAGVARIQLTSDSRTAASALSK
jgi:hypothetical protein